MAGLYRHPRGLELRVGFEPTRGPGDILHTHVEHTANMGILELDAAALRDRLANAGWIDSEVPSP
jgi:hypothetical protein